MLENRPRLQFLSPCPLATKPSSISQHDHNSHLTITKDIVRDYKKFRNHMAPFTAEAFELQVYHFHCCSYQIVTSIIKHLMVTAVRSKGENQEAGNNHWGGSRKQKPKQGCKPAKKQKEKKTPNAIHNYLMLGISMPVGAGQVLGTFFLTV